MSLVNTITDNVKKVFRQFLSDEVPQKFTNVFYQLYVGLETSLTHLETKLDIFRRERNRLTATKKSSLRNLAAANGYEPTLKIPASGVVRMKLPSNIFSRNSYPLFLPAYAQFTNLSNNLTYLYNSDKALRIIDNEVNISLTEGILKTSSFASTGQKIERYYLSEENIADASIVVEVGNIRFTEVKSFFDNDGLNNNKQFLVKYGVDSQKPIIIYVKGTELNDAVNVTYRLTFGELGILNGNTSFETSDVIDVSGEPVDLSSDEVTIINISGFDFGSNGDDENSLRSAIGFNHGNSLLYDKISYNNFLNKYSTLIIQNIIPDESRKSIMSIYLSKKVSFDFENLSEDNTQLILDYKLAIDNKKYVLSGAEKVSLNNIINKNEFCLSSHNIYDVTTNKYSLQIMFDNIRDRDAYIKKLSVLIYAEFSKFLFDRNHSINFELIFDKFIKEYSVNFEYHIMNEDSNDDYIVSHEIKHIDKLPILRGDFTIKDENNTIYTLYNDINFVVKS